MSDVTCPVAQHHKRYSSIGLLQRYARHKRAHLHIRILFSLAWCAFVAIAATPQIAFISFVLVVLGDVTETHVLLRFVSSVDEKKPAPRVQVISVLTGFFDAVLFATAVGLPTYLCSLKMNDLNNYWEPVFTIYMLVGASLVYVMFLPLNPLSVIIRMAIYFVVPAGILTISASQSGVDSVSRNLDLGGMAFFTVTTIWIARLVHSRHDRRRRMELQQAMQRRELQNAYAQMYAQQVEARRLALVAESANDSVMITNRDLEITWVNESFSRITGYSAMEAIGQRPGELLNCKDTDMDVVADMNERIARGENVREVLLCRRKEGSNIWLETSQVPMMNAAGELETLIAVERDITASKIHQAELEKARLAAEEGARTKAEFLATMSHEIRTPLNGVIGMAQLLEHTKLTIEQRKYTQTIHSSARSLLALINDILEMSKMDACEITLSPAVFDVRQCFETTLSLLEPLALEKHIALNLRIASDVPAELIGDDRRITQILMNMVGNAIKFTSKGHVSVEVGCDWLGHRPELWFSVTDTGIGIPAEKLEKIFEQFSQADVAVSRRFGGTGLGLTISKRLAHAMGGNISVTSTLGQGACFTASLVLQARREVDRPAIVNLPDRSEHLDLKNMRILIADDNQVNRLLVQKFLNGSNAQLGFAVDGKQAIDIAQTLKPQIILMDLSMPEVNGLDATRAIRNLDIPRPYIVALTANAFHEDRAACLDAGMDDFLTKPLSRQLLLDSLAKAVQQDLLHSA